MAEWFSSKIVRLNELNDDETKKEILMEVYIKLQGVTVRELEEVSRNVDLSGLFSQLTSNDRPCVEETCKILKVFLDGLAPGEALARYSAELRRSMVNAEPSVRTLVLRELDGQAEKPEGSRALLGDVDLLARIIERIGDEDPGVASLAMSVVKRIGSLDESAKVLYSGTSLRTMARLLSKNDVASFRVYEIVVTIAKTSDGCLRASIDSGFLNGLIKILENGDVLLQLNALELMADLATSEAGLDYLEERNVLKRLAERIERASEDPLSNLFVPGLMKFFGSVARCRPNEIFAKYPIVVSSLFEIIRSEETCLLGNALDTLGLVASSVEAKYALQMLGDSMPSALKRIGEIVRQSPAELRVRALENLALLLRIETSEQDNRILSLAKSWFDYLGDEPLGTIVALCKQPFADVRHSSLEVLAAISAQNWGQEYIAECPGLIEFLLDRGAESFKSCKDLKHRIVKNVEEADELRDVFDAETRDKLEKFVRQGPYHVDADTEIATEEAC